MNSAIIESIQNIVAQTNLLAAWAGEHGRRFATVAGEVRKIAEYALKLWAESMTRRFIKVRHVELDLTNNNEDVQRKIHKKRFSFSSY
ncbi:methyl-accepting chemotaxis protein [Paenibacillus polymyxa]|uniref:methyl-accepting chemotaxis protein n=1 Tax=Paenibacillus polymyxa TaxID=1406 RepID=UPI003EB8FF0B